MFLIDLLLLGIVNLFISSSECSGSGRDDTMTYLILDELDNKKRDTDFQESDQTCDFYDADHFEGCDWE
jgi:hypothetical protein